MQGMSDLRVLASAMLLAAGVAAAVSAATLRLGADGAPRIASVRLAELAAAHAAEAARTDGTPQQMAAAVRAWAAALQAALGEVAEGYGTVLLPTQAVAAGAPDLTPAVEAAMARTLRGEAAGEAGR